MSLKRILAERKYSVAPDQGVSLVIKIHLECARDGKGRKDRVTMLPQALVAPLKQHLAKVTVLHEEDLAEGFGEEYLPFALARKYTAASREWGWQYVFPARRRSIDPRSGKERRHHIAEKTLQEAMKNAVRAAKIAK